MKKINFLLVALVMLAVSCSSDDDNSAPEQGVTASILGTWNMTEYNYSGTTETKVLDQVLITEFVGEAFNIEYNIVFEEDPNIVTSNGGFDVRVTSTVLGQTSTETVRNLSSIESGDWEIVDENILRSTTNGETTDILIETLTDTDLVLLVENKQTLTDTGFSTDVDLIARLSFERQ